eukprot:1805918-Rhodomonas_salina.1
MQEVENKVVWPGAIFVRKNNTEINTFEDMRGERIAAGARHARVVYSLQADRCASHGFKLHVLSASKQDTFSTKLFLCSFSRSDAKERVG